jgi:adhesin/invasin
MVIALAAGLSGCGGDKLTLPGDATPTKIEMVTGDAQAGIVGTALPLPLVVKVTDELGRAVVNQNVTFTVQSGAGQVSPGSMATGSDGRASTTWTLGPNAGAQGVQAQAVGGGAPDNLVVAFGATAVAGSGSLIAAVSGNDQSAPVNSALTDSLVVKVSDGSNNPVSGITVQWTAVGGGSVSPATVVTGADGRAATARVLGPIAGQQSAQAAADGLAGSPVTFVHTALASNPTTLTKVSGDGQTAPAGFEVAEDLVVRLSDDNDNGVGGVGVTWVVPPGDGAVNPLNSTTDPNGLAHTRWTLGATAGPYTLTAVSGTLQVQFTATASADVPTKIALQSGNNQSAITGQGLPNPLAVKVTDANNNPVENVSVSWTANGGGSVSSPTSATNAQGIAQVTRTLGVTPGTYTTTADVPGLTGTPITFTSTATVGPAAKIVVTTEPGSTAANGAVLSPQPVVQVQDVAGNNVGPAGRTITADLINSPSGGSLNGDKTKDTDANGQAVFTDLNITGPVGSYTIRFRSGALTSATSTAISVTAGAPSGQSSTVSASPTSIAVGEASTITVTAKDAGGNLVPGVTVTLQAGGSGNSLTQPAAQTDANGQTTGTFSSTSTGQHIITATVNGTTVQDNATVTVTTGPPASIAINGGNNQTAAAGSAVSTDPSVIVKDAGGNPVANVDVTFAVASGGGSVSGATPKTNGSGIATVGSWTLGPTAGTNNNTLTATAAGSGISGNPVTFTASATAGAPSASQSTLTVDQNTISAGGTSTVTVTAKDAGGNPISGATVVLSATGNGNSFSAPAPTNGSGVTTSTYTGTQAGAHTISAQINGVTINATATVTVQAGAAAALTFTQQPPGIVSTNTQFTVVVGVRDAFNNPTDATVQMVLNQDTGATLSGTLSVSSVGGSATFSDLSVDQPSGLNPYTLTASATGASSDTSNGFFVTP